MEGTRSAEERARIGSRFVCEGNFGTIRYIGEVPPTKGLWYGVEWDEGCRGRHSGTHEGIQYFTCMVPNSGSFVRPKKVDLGQSFTDVVQERYRGTGSEKEVGWEEHYVSVKQVELVGLDKVAKWQSRLDQLYEVSVQGLLLSSAGAPGEVASTTPNVMKLDLSHSPLLSSWEVVTGIASQLPRLTTLQLSECKHLSMPLDVSSFSFSSLRALYINKMALSWKEVSTILKMTPNLKELHACENKIANLSNKEDLPPSLTLLNLEENLLSDWSNVQTLKDLPKLKTLILNDNQFKEILFEEFKDGDFVMLENLSLGRNLISDWNSINNLAGLPALSDLKFKGNPLNPDEPVLDTRQQIIASLEHLRTLNNSLITRRERVLAERYYLKRYLLDFTSSIAGATVSPSPPATSTAVTIPQAHHFHQLHPRYQHLASVHGLPESSVMAGERLGGSQASVLTALKDRLIAVTIKSPTNPSLKPLTKKLPSSMTVQKLKSLLQRLYKVDTSQQKLSYLDQDGSHEIELSDDLKQLSFYSIESGDTILLRYY